MTLRKAFKNQVFHDIEIVDIAEEGKGVGKHEGLVLFVDKAIPGDVVDVEIVRRKKKLYEARIIEIKKPSEWRTDPFCSHFGVCGGCKWQHLTYDGQLHFKQKMVESTLQRLGGVDTTHIEPILGSEKNRYYRNKLEFTFSNKRWFTEADDILEGEEQAALGFHVPRRFDKILPIEHCYLQEDPSNAIRNKIDVFAKENKISYYDLKEHTGSLRNLIIRTSSIGEQMVIVVFAHPQQGEVEKVMAFVDREFPDITSLLYVINQKRNDTIFDQEVLLYKGNEYIFEEMEGLSFKIGPKSFYQTNSLQAYELYKLAREFAGLTGKELVYDLYTGAGTIAQFLAKEAKKVVGVEYVPSAIEDAWFNVEHNGIDNTVFYAGDMKDVLTPEFVIENGKPDVIITDPPRAGMHPSVVKRILEIEAEKIVYVSCNVATQARDLSVLTEKYEVERIRPVDMFPHTQHVENVVLLRKKKEDGSRRFFSE